MTYTELTMIDVKEVLRRWSAGHGDRKIPREAGADRKTIARYTKAATTLGLERGCDLTDEVVHNVAQCVHARPLTTPSDEWREVARYRPLIERWLAGDRDTRPLKHPCDSRTARALLGSRSVQAENPRDPINERASYSTVVFAGGDNFSGRSALPAGSRTVQPAIWEDCAKYFVGPFTIASRVKEPVHERVGSIAKRTPVR